MVPVQIVTNANVSQVLAHPISSSKTPPMTGPITVPNALAVLKRAEALSFIYVFFLTFSFCSIASISSESNGTNTQEVVMPVRQSPTTVKGIFY